MNLFEITIITPIVDTGREGVVEFITMLNSPNP